MKTTTLRRLATLFMVIALQSMVIAKEGPTTTIAVEQQAERAKRDMNKKTVAAFYIAIARNDFEAARQHLGDYYLEHDPEREDGLSGLQKALDYNRRHGINQNILSSIVVAEGDYVVMYSESLTVTAPPPGMPPMPTVPATTAVREPDLIGDIFRLEQGKIVEHWNAIYKP